MRQQKPNVAKSPPREPQVYPVCPDKQLLRSWVKAGSWRYPRGHSGFKRLNPHLAETNQSCWLQKRQLPVFTWMDESIFARQLQAFLWYGFIDQRIDRRITYYRVSWYGQMWLEGEVAGPD